MVNSGKSQIGHSKRDGSADRKDDKDRRLHKSNNERAESESTGRVKQEKRATSETEHRRDGKSSRFDSGATSSKTKEEFVSDQNDLIPKRFTGRCRLFIGNVPPDTKEKEFESWFKPYGECSEIFLNPLRGFGFVRMDTREHCEAAKRGVDGLEKRGRFLRVRYAAHTAAVRVKYLNPTVSNELLYEAFSMFGEIERAIVAIDERGKSTGEGLVEFARKPGANAAIKRVNEGVFLLGSSPKPLACEMLVHKDEEDGMPEVFMSKNQDFIKEREAPPRFAAPGSFEFSFAQKWKELYAQYDQQKKLLEMQFQEAVSKLELDEVNARMEHQTAVMREDLLRRQDELRKMEEMHKVELQRRMVNQRLNDDPNRRIEAPPRGFDRRHQEDVQRRLDERHREVQTRIQQEMAMRQLQEERRGHQADNTAPMQPPPAPPLGGRPDDDSSGRARRGDSDYRQSRFDQPPQQQHHQSRFDQQQQSRFDQGQPQPSRFDQGQGQQSRFDQQHQSRFDQGQQQQQSRFDQGQGQQSRFDQGQGHQSRFDQGQQQQQSRFDQGQGQQSRFDQGQGQQSRFDQGQGQQSRFDQGQGQQYPGNQQALQGNQQAMHVNQQGNQQAIHANQPGNQQGVHGNQPGNQQAMHAQQGNQQAMHANQQAMHANQQAMQQQMMHGMGSPPANPQQLMNRLGQLGVAMGGQALGNLGQQMLAAGAGQAGDGAGQMGGGGPMGGGTGPMGDGGNGVGDVGSQGPSPQQMKRPENAGRWDSFDSKRPRRF